MTRRIVLKKPPLEKKVQASLDLTLFAFDHKYAKPCLYCGKIIMHHRWAFRVWVIEQDDDGNNKLHICNEYLNATPEKHREVHRKKTFRLLAQREAMRQMSFIKKYGEAKLHGLFA